MRGLTLSIVVVASVFLLSGCDREEKRRQWEAQRTKECLDKICEGDIEPKRNMETEVALKLNGQWFIGPKEYFNGYDGRTGFEWWEHKPISSHMKRPPELQAAAVDGKGYDFAIEIFLTHHDAVTHGPTRSAYLKQAEAEGRLISKTTPRPGLEVWRVREADGLSPAVWYVATAYAEKDPNGSVLACRDSDPKFDRCTTAFIWKPGIAADMRFRAKHAPDWPEIYLETIRILQLLRKA